MTNVDQMIEHHLAWVAKVRADFGDRFDEIIPEVKNQIRCDATWYSIDPSGDEAFNRWRQCHDTADYTLDGDNFCPAHIGTALEAARG